MMIPIERQAEADVEEILKEVSDWLLAQPDWLQEAAERLLRQGDLGAIDFADLCELIKTAEGRKPTNHRDFGELLNVPEIKGEMRISSLGEIGGIENIAPKEPLRLGKGNLVIIYGNTGSGRPGYPRFSKRHLGSLAPFLSNQTFLRQPRLCKSAESRMRYQGKIRMLNGMQQVPTSAIYVRWTYSTAMRLPTIFETRARPHIPRPS